MRHHFQLVFHFPFNLFQTPDGKNQDIDDDIARALGNTQCDLRKPHVVDGVTIGNNYQVFLKTNAPITVFNLTRGLLQRRKLINKVIVAYVDILKDGEINRNGTYKVIWPKDFQGEFWPDHVAREPPKVHPFQLVFQFPTGSLESMDFEDDIAEALGNKEDSPSEPHVVDGNSLGEDTCEIFVSTGNPKTAFSLARKLLKSRKLLEKVTVAYIDRLPDGSINPESEYIVIWPKGFQGKFSP